MDKIWRELGLTDEEYEKIISILGREPNITEIGMYSVMWSEHCAYKNSKPLLKYLPTKGERVIQGPGENAGVLDIGDNLAVVMKIESHNHPSAIEPYQGAATGVGGIIRDIFTMGARPIALLDSLRFGIPDDKRTKYLIENVVAGIADYGNCIGIPTVGGDTYFEESYKGNPLVNAMCVGIVEKDKIKKGIAKGIGNPVMIVGATTGRDGIGGASFASQELSEESEEKRPSVQVGDPFMEKLLLEACLELFETDAVVAIQDMGAAGLTSSSCEMASRGGVGMEIDLDKVPLREKGMTPYEIMLSESQERMLVVVEKGKEEDVQKVFKKWGLNAATIGKITDDGMIRVIKEGKIVAEVPAKSLAEDAPQYIREEEVPKWQEDVNKLNINEVKPPEDMNKALKDVISSLNVASKEWIYSQYDYMVRTDTAITPGMDAAVVRIKGTKKAIALTTDCNGRYCYLDPYIGSQIAVAEAARNLCMVGAKPIGVTDCLNFGNPEKKEIYWQLKNSIFGIAKACETLQIPVVSGNVSLYNENEEGAIYPTPVIGMAGLIEDVSKICTMDFKKERDVIIILGENKGEIGGSEYLKVCFGMVKGQPPQIDLEEEKRLQELVLKLIEEGLINSSHDISEGGFAAALVESAISGKKGAKISLQTSLREDVELFSESPPRALITVSPEKVEEVLKIAYEYQVPAQKVGVVEGKKIAIEVNGKKIIDLPLEVLEESWRGRIKWEMERN
ncbi:phosphoribosylformylglycinamidine synthase subunit PurL [Thermoanaerobacter sp. X514]|uniref:Phosphoribosylformylglycinamidine synthase subunit PurL n=1 Tax=Thermoanaerobacter sp. (strain X514) TaxID=399726 RepID=PURL_THEPX|nr:phosphoribosylformylglycinamidine synthase subunit PurL [Thermoanaerobacter sp. X514]B0K3Q4.1 RecName: Full=Phosphoribosylformylglycinamidine synthase subunit PurL; Short=FGAM synthase; AltName: Full=Formylglycinamide ribonucleotide amidotransferase subunit II; Short=FGAR amidotransferase II; Short=FGAR-AT II; AltName: Full=Glutamine amidotransferase PurL; AltName: Full=Phosphoribosylformylglycinamidine synthase subunit II [Thermoanaerobacter sp. X514]ABY91829.1 phosphoribosylformylglycinamidi